MHTPPLLAHTLPPAHMHPTHSLHSHPHLHASTCTRTCTQHRHSHLHAAATARTPLPPQQLALVTPAHTPACPHWHQHPRTSAHCTKLHPTARLCGIQPCHLKPHPTTRICTTLALAPGSTHAIPRLLGGRITGEGGDGDLLGGAQPRDGGDMLDSFR
jgi:hypothetical protein